MMKMEQLQYDKDPDMNSSLRLVIFGAIIAIYLDWTRLFSDVGALVGVIAKQAQELPADKPE